MGSGNPAKAEPEKVYGYLVLDVITELQEGVDPGDYAPEKIEAGTIMLRLDNPGTGSHPFVFEDGPFKTIVTAVYVATGLLVDGKPTFDYGNGKVMNLISIGLESEKVLKDQIHDVLDRVKEALEPISGNSIEQMVAVINDLEAGLWRKH